MPDTTVTHELLRAGQLALIDRFTAHEKQYREDTSKLFDKVDRAIDASYENRIHITTMQTNMSAMLENRAAQLTRFENMERRVDDLSRDGYVKQGQRSVWLSILNSRPVAWLAGVLVAAGAFLAGQGGMKP